MFILWYVICLFPRDGCVRESPFDFVAAGNKMPTSKSKQSAIFFFFKTLDRLARIIALRFPSTYRKINHRQKPSQPDLPFPPPLLAPCFPVPAISRPFPACPLVNLNRRSRATKQSVQLKTTSASATTTMVRLHTYLLLPRPARTIYCLCRQLRRLRSKNQR